MPQPLTTSVTFVPTGEAGVSLNLRNDLKVVLTMLRGRMIAFVEVCFIFCETAEVTLFEIAPLRFQQSLFNTDTSIPLGPLLKFRELRGVEQ